MRALRALTIANVRSFVRDRAALFWTLAFPLIFIFLFGFIFQGSGGAGLDVAWADEDGSPASAQLRTAFAAAEGVDVTDQDRAAAHRIDAGRRGRHGDRHPGGVRRRSRGRGSRDRGARPDRGLHRPIASAAPGFGLPGRRERARRRQPRRPAADGRPDPADRPDREPELHQLLRAEHPRPVGHAARHLRGRPAGRRPREGDPQAAVGDPASALAAGRVQHPDAAADRAGPDGHHRRGRQRVLRRAGQRLASAGGGVRGPGRRRRSSRWATSWPRSPGPRRRPTASPRSSSSR